MQTIAVLILISGFIAYVGDWLGRRIGRMRLTVLGLRPKNTAIVISVLTGMLITILSLAVLAALSDEARVGLLYADRIRAENRTLETLRVQLAAEADHLSGEVRILSNNVLELQKTVEALKTGDLAFQMNEVLGYLPVKGRVDPASVVAAVRELIGRGHDTAEKLGFKVKPLDEIWRPMSGTIEIFAKSLDAASDVVIVLRTRERVAKGEELNLALQAVANRVIFRRGDALDGEIDADRDRESIRRSVLEFHEEISRFALERGMVLDPMRTVDSIATLDLVNELKRRGGKLRLSLIIGADCGVAGPFHYSLAIEPGK